MQTLYALRQANQSTKQLAVDGINDQFQPDLNSMLPQNRRQLEGYRKLAALLFDEAVRTNEPAQDQEVPKSVIDAVNDAVTYYQNRYRKDQQFLSGRLIEAVKDIYSDYLRVLQLLVEFGHMSRLDRERRFPDPDETPFVYASDLSQNRIIEALTAHQPLQVENTRRGISWTEDLTFVRKTYREVLKTDETFIAYCAARQHTPDEDQQLVQHLLRQLIFKHDTVRDHLAEIDLAWTENSEVVRGMAIRTLKSVQGPQGLTLEQLTEDWEEDERFLNELYQNALTRDAEVEKLLGEQLNNWELDRVAILDLIILKLAVCEMLTFPNIPTKVTINEYIDMAKAYSTPKSGTFVNGILDNLATRLTTEGKLRKSGRGLLDNK
ncbi:transcription antitermination factor NusB [Fibrella sp. HMF5335]|uniref:Transcription antitermination protein NusB n=1 Tax=Fibrella rubiginis TaxID=2817060 RepID=A0A939GDW5_9BACT|nr:transcription antitermination factor NusB [Fibrella rubiginis]MBO0935983.1 transcription antitermination factor NusB [Fibrella rubiginis]